MDPHVSETPHPEFSRRMFAFGEEQVGIKVTEDQKSSCISKIINALEEEEEIVVNRASTFEKLLAIAKETSILGLFWAFPYIQAIESFEEARNLVLFAGKPVRFSIREFPLVTALNFRRFPPHSKKRSTKNISCKAQVISIISAGVEQNNVNPELGWSDDEEDVQVDNIAISQAEPPKLMLSGCVMKPKRKT
ncbi:hypothetical protein IGI04_008626 [Brassica rapa subsp. trilocularis]|uniref:Uncharacterized protein n=1 Tax=Brassica rapa subsp. trilocularis TaxID=1813537 RepID=A0ABQ7N4R7_BRACM|nr:hypothetical protein IGI04_012022 [Brassica rapa subsp. trilocularis]KAG5412307.1 hypothetical protein IGI04_008626 [Brassica rapa subsp. trilocularis]